MLENVFLVKQSKVIRLLVLQHHHPDLLSLLASTVACYYNTKAIFVHYDYEDDDGSAELL